MGVYEVRIGRHKGRANREYAIQRATQVANSDGITVVGTPSVRKRRVPVPLIGPRREYVVRFDDATKVNGQGHHSHQSLGDLEPRAKP